MIAKSMSVSILFDIMFESGKKPFAWNFESDWSPLVPRNVLQELEKEGYIEIDRADVNDWAVKQTAAGKRFALESDAA